MPMHEGEAKKARNDPAERAREEERRRIASEVHDRVLQALAEVALRLEAARKHLGQTEEETRNELRISEEGVRSSIRELRSVLASGDKRPWRAGTLLEKIRNEVQAIERSTDVEIPLKIDPPDMALCDAHLEYEVFQATREALRNVVRHAGATEARLRIALTRNTLQVSLSDNGEGLDTSAKTATRDRTGDGNRSSYGLQTMQSRIERLGGSIAIDSQPQQGTTVAFDVPLPVKR